MPGSIELIGVYQLPVTEELVAKQAELSYGEAFSPEQRAQVRELLESAVLVEVLVSDADADFNVGGFMQENPELPPMNWQAAWAEAFLSADGDRLLAERWNPLPPGHTTFRVTFFIHEWRVDRALLSSYGSLPGGAPTPMPERLRELVPYELLD